jgi:putative ABC transport system permease protein
MNFSTGLVLGGWKQAWRQVAAKPFLALSIVVTLALGIGASSTVFSFVYGMLLRPYPYTDPDRLVRVQTLLPESAGNIRGISILDLDDLRARTSAVEAFGSYLAFPNTLTVEGQAHAVNLTFLDARTFPLLGVTPILGRGFTPEEDRFNGDVNKALLSHALWRDMFGGNPGILGKVIEARGDHYTVIGVMPPGFGFPEKTDLWIPMMARYAGYREPYWRKRDFRVHDVVARLRPAVTLEQAQGEVNAAVNALAREFPETNKGTQIRLTPLRDSEMGRVAPYLRLLLIAVTMLLLIGCMNAANLSLAGAAARQKEMSIRVALGAGRWTIVRQLLKESVLLSVAGGVVGVALAWAAVKAFPAFFPLQLPFWVKIQLDPQVIGFSVILSMATGLLFGLSPALQLARVDLNSVLKEGSRGSSSASGRLRNALVVIEVALSIVLLCSAGLMVKSLVNLDRVDMGVKKDHLVVARMARFVSNATQEELARQYGGSFRHAVEQIAVLPGVQSVGIGTEIPYSSLEPRGDSRDTQDFTIRGQDQREAMRNAPTQFASIGPGIFETLGIHMVEGRGFNEADDLTQPVRIIINHKMAETLWPGQTAIGHQLRWGGNITNPWMNVIGVVEDVKYNPLEQGLGFETYVCYRQIPIPQMQAVVRVRGDPETMLARIRAAIQAADSQIAIVHVKTLESLASETLWQRRLWGLLMSVFAGLALLLTCVGLYSVMSCVVSLRTREIGIRMALGAPRLTVLALITGHGMLITLAGVGIGLAVAVAVGRVMRDLLFGVGGSRSGHTLCRANGIAVGRAFRLCLSVDSGG